MDTLQDNTDEQLVELAKSGSKHAFDVLIERYRPKIINLLTRYVNDPTEAADLAQEVSVRVYTALPDFRGESSFYTWLYRVAINIAKNTLIHSGRRPNTVSVDFDQPIEMKGRWTQEDTETPEACVLSEETEMHLINAVYNLPEELKLVFILREIEGFSYEDIADLLDCPVGTIRSRLHRVRTLIDQEL